jgi:hypothetical protein
VRSFTLIQLSPHVMLALLGLGATAIAAWFFVRYPKAAPADVGRLLAHLILAAMIIQFVVPTAMGRTGGSQVSTLAGIFGVGFPALVYCMLTGLWLLAWATRMLDRHG